MNQPLIRRGISLVLSLTLALSASPLTALATQEDGLCKHHPAHTTDCGYAENGICTHVCAEDNGCIAIRCRHEHDLTCHHTDGTLNCPHACTEEPACYTPITECLHTQHGDCGHSDGGNCDFAENGCPECEAEASLIQIKGTDVTIDGYTFPYTGQEIRPQITVQVEGSLLTEGVHYTLTYANNLAVGQASVTVTGIPENGYDGIVTIPFTIAHNYTMVEIKGTDVIIHGTEFDYTGQEIKPAVTVTVDGKELTAGRDYSVTYRNNIEPGTATVTVMGIATASETLGYTGTVEIDFTIKPVQEPEETEPEATEPEATEPETTEPEATEPEVTEPEATEPEVTEPETTEPEETEPEQTRPIEYKITKGNAATWYQGSGKTLSFTVNGAGKDFTGISINGKKLNKEYYSTKDNTVVTLNTGFLNKLTVGKYTITVHFEDGDAKGSFRVSDQLDTTNPVTGDSGIAAAVTVMLGSLAALGGAAYVYRKRFTK